MQRGFTAFAVHSVARSGIDDAGGVRDDIRRRPAAIAAAPPGPVRNTTPLLPTATPVTGSGRRRHHPQFHPQYHP
jgi:hypothetical protein